MKELNCRVRDVIGGKGVVAIDLSGGIFASNLQDLNELIRIQLNRKISDLILNFGSLDFISSSGIGLVVDANEEFRRAAKRLWITDMNPDVLRVFEQFSLDTILRIVPDEQKAVAEIKQLISD